MKIISQPTGGKCINPLLRYLHCKCRFINIGQTNYYVLPTYISIQKKCRAKWAVILMPLNMPVSGQMYEIIKFPAAAATHFHKISITGRPSYLSIGQINDLNIFCKWLSDLCRKNDGSSLIYISDNLAGLYVGICIRSMRLHTQNTG